MLDEALPKTQDARAAALARERFTPEPKPFLIEAITVKVMNRCKSNAADSEYATISLARVKWMERVNV